MADRPILFSSPMVLALIAARKTQTRRILKPQPEHLQVYDWKGKRIHDSEYRHWCWRGHVGADNWDSITAQLRPCLPIKAGDRLWVKETWAPLSALKHNDPGTQALIEKGFFRADGSVHDDEIDRWRPSIFMPRRVSRLTLIVEDVRIERLQDISEADAIAEGVAEFSSADKDGRRHFGVDSHEAPIDEPTARMAYSIVWDWINGAGSWHKSPWIAAYTFRVIKQNIDQIGAGHG